MNKNSKKKKEFALYLKKIHALLKRDEINICIKRMKTKEGASSFFNIWLNPDYNLISVLIHECLHIIYPQKKERWILKKEKFIFKRLSEVQIKNLLIFLGDILMKSNNTKSKKQKRPNRGLKS